MCSNDTTTVVKIFVALPTLGLISAIILSQSHQDYSILDNKLQWDRNLSFNHFENIICNVLMYDQPFFVLL